MQAELIKYFYIAAMLGAIAITAMVLWPFMTALAAAAIAAYILYPVYKALDKKLKRSRLSAAMVSIAIILLMAFPAVFVLDAAAKEAYTTYLLYKQKVAGKDLLSINCREGFLCERYKRINEFLTESPRIKLYIENTVAKASSYILEKAQGFVISLPLIILHTLIAMISTYFFLIDGEKIIRKADAVLPFKEHHKHTLVGRFNEISKALIYGQILIALLEGALAALGFFIFGISSPVLWGVVVVILGLIPIVGASLIWVPASAVLVISGIASGNVAFVWKGVGLFAYSLIFVSSVETLLKPHIIGQQAKMHPLLVFLAAIGGISLFGIIGFFLGPLAVAFFLAMLEIYEKDVKGA